MSDAIVIGAGPNGLVAANHLADAGWQVHVLEAQPRPGGAVKTAELTEPGFRHDSFSAFYPLAAASPAIRRLELERHGLEWRHGPLVLAHPRADGSCVALSRDLDETAASLDGFAAGDGDAWRRLFELWLRVREPLLQGLGTPMPPVVPALGVAGRLGPGGLLRFLRMAVLPVRRLATEHFRGEGAGRLLAGNALHADLAPESALSAFYGWFLSSLGQDVGFPFPRGGAGQLTAALVRRLESLGGTITCNARVEQILVRRRRAVGVRLEGGEEVGARHAVLADVSAPSLYLRLLPRDLVPARALNDLRRFEWDWSTFKVDWALDGLIPWTAPDARRSPVVHIAEGIDELTETTAQLARGLVPERPFLIFGQYSMGDSTRAPEGKESAWAYTHVPRGAESDAEGLVERIEERVEELAPGFRGLVLGRHVATPGDLEQADENLVDGAINGGTAQLHQQLVWRPTTGLGRPETPVACLYLASASAHPGGGVHGGPGAIAARAALNGDRIARAAVVVGAASLAAATRSSARAYRARRA
ncbi:MAG: phytoene desaturase family protein [Gaiellaceae bacterium]